MKSKKYKVVVVGALSHIGREIIKILGENNLWLEELLAVNGDKEQSKEISFGDTVCQTVKINTINFGEIDLVFLCDNSESSYLYIKNVVNKDCLIIGSSSIFNNDASIPLVIPEVNGYSYLNVSTLASPNSNTIALALALKPLNNAVKIKRLIISTYQSVSSKGKDGLDELYNQTKAKYGIGQILPSVFNKPIAFNIVPQIGDFADDANTMLEQRIARELTEVLSADASYSITCVRVPVFIGDSMSINVEFKAELEPEEAIEILSEADSVVVLENENELRYLTPIEIVDEDSVYISRIRKDTSRPNCLNLWLTINNMRKGYALNFVHIAETIIKHKNK